MHVDDIDTATAIEEAAFGCELPQRDYHYELERNLLAHYFVLHVHPARLGLDQAATHPARSDLIIGLGGFWLIGDSVHIMTIAVWPRWRGLGLGEWLLLTLLKEGRSLGADYATLEVRPSNRVAISLYQKYRFQEVGRRTAYYSDNGEDALILTTPSIVLTDYKVLLIQRQQQLTRHLGQIQVDKIGHTG
jgi:ribosomal-protein-alanine acetyltransferase